MLLVSVRSQDEARAAVAGGAAIIDVKEPSRGSLGMAPSFTWRRVREAVPPSIIVSVALGELTDWTSPERIALSGNCWTGINFRKVGLAGAGPSWRDRWRDLRQQLARAAAAAEDAGRPGWVAVAYLDWEVAGAPEPLAVIDEATTIRECTGVLLDTWDKSRRVVFDPTWGRWIRRVKESGRFVALAGSLDEAEIRRLRPIDPDIFAVRGAACRDGDRTGPIDAGRVARLVEAAGP